MTVADPCVGSYGKHSEGYPVSKCNTFAIHSKENKRVESWEKHADFSTKMKEPNRSNKSQTNINKIHDPYSKYVIFKPFHPQNRYLKENWEEGKYRLDKTV